MTPSTPLTTTTRSRLIAASALLLCVTSALACDHPASNVTVETTAVDPEATPPTVSLPPPPSVDDFVIKEKNDDGSFRVQGLIENKPKYLDKEVVVKGKIVKLSPDCDPVKAQKNNEKCPELHLIIQDDEEEAEKQLLVVGYKDDFLKRAKINEGEVHQFKAMYKMMGWGFTASEDGLLELVEVDDISVIDEKKK